MINTNRAILREALWNVYKGHCGYCSKSIDLQDFDIEHIIPQDLLKLTLENKNEFLRKHGLPLNFAILELENLYVSCGGCNSKKSKLILNPGSLAIHLARALENKEKVLNEIKKLKKNKIATSYFLALMSDLEKQNFAQEVDMHSNRLAQASGHFQLSDASSLFGEEEERYISLSKFEEYLDIELKYSWLEEGLELICYFPHHRHRSFSHERHQSFAIFI